MKTKNFGKIIPDVQGPLDEIKPTYSHKHVRKDKHKRKLPPNSNRMPKDKFKDRISTKGHMTEIRPNKKIFSCNL